MLGALVGAGSGLVYLMTQSGPSIRWIWWVALAGLALVFAMAAHDEWRDRRK